MMLVHVATLVSLSPLSSLSSVVCIHIDKNVVEQKLCNNVPM
jgi:phage terminase large subunit-like protein